VSQKEKLIKRFLSFPSDFTYKETVKLLGYFGYEENNNDGSRRAFIHAQTLHIIKVHEPHPENTMKKCYLRQIKEALEMEGYL